MGDLGIPTISCMIGTQSFDQFVYDLGASVSVMAKVIYDKLSHDSLVPTSMHLQLADQSIHCPVRITEDVPVRIRNSFVSVDFVVLEMDIYRQTPLFLAMPFLSIAGATIDVVARIINLNINEKEETFAFKLKRIEYYNQIGVSTGSTGKSAKTPIKKPDATKYSKPKSIWRVMFVLCCCEYCCSMKKSFKKGEVCALI
jgi:hypothetical protein